MRLCDLTGMLGLMLDVAGDGGAGGGIGAGTGGVDSGAVKPGANDQPAGGTGNQARRWRGTPAVVRRRS